MIFFVACQLWGARQDKNPNKEAPLITLVDQWDTVICQIPPLELKLCLHCTWLLFHWWGVKFRYSLLLFKYWVFLFGPICSGTLYINHTGHRLTELVWLQIAGIKSAFHYARAMSSILYKKLLWTETSSSHLTNFLQGLNCLPAVCSYNFYVREINIMWLYEYK